MFMNAMVRIFSWGERWNVPFNEAIGELNGTTEWKYSYHCTHKHSLFVLYNTKIDYWLLQGLQAPAILSLVVE